MHNDEQFTHALSDAFRSTTDGLAYHGAVPTPSPSPLIAAPVVAAGAVGVGLAIASAVAGQHTGPRTAAQPLASTTPIATDQPSAAPSTEVVSRTIELAGYSFSYRQAAGATPLHGALVSAVPSDARPVHTDWTAQTYLGVDPQTNAPAAYVATPSGKVLMITSPDATDAELTAMVQSQASPVPVVESANG